MQVSLVMFKADGSRRDFPVTGDRMVVGRKNNCDLRIPLSSVSRQHCEIRIEDDQARVRDLGSSNGTYHNGIRVQETTLAPGDEIVVGPVVFVVVIDGTPDDIPATRTVLADAADEDEGGRSPSMPTMVPETDRPLPASPLDDDDDDDQLPQIDADLAAPTVDLNDDDPIAALERLAEAERLSSTSSGAPFDFDIDLEDDEDDDEKP